MELMDRYPYLATFGFMIQDTSAARCARAWGGSPLIRYSLNEPDLRQMQRGFEILCAVYQAAGARRVLPLIAGHDEATHARPARSPEGEPAPRGRPRGGGLPPARHLPHRRGRRGVPGPDHEVRDAPGVYVCDGSAVPSSLGVNPQMTIMAMALRAAEGIDAALS